MRRVQLREPWSDDELARMYAKPHDHRGWGDHILRVDATIKAGLELVGDGVSTAADLSCGSGAILDAMPAAVKFYGDLAPGYEFTGPLDDTIQQIPDVDLFISTETIEHLPNPDATLKAIGAKARMLLLSTPIDAWDDGNLEHYWAWDRAAVEAMLTAAGFRVLTYRYIWPSYKFGIWTCAT